MDAKTVERFWAKVDRRGDDECWEWQANLSDCGYGRFWMSGRLHAAHRVARLLATGSDAGDMCVLHTCDNPSCVNPAHLWLGTPADNASDRETKGRGNQPVGTRVAGARLDEFTVRLILRLYPKVKQAVMARVFGVSTGAVKHVCARRHWKHVA